MTAGATPSRATAQNAPQSSQQAAPVSPCATGGYLVRHEGDQGGGGLQLGPDRPADRPRQAGHRVLGRGVDACRLVLGDVQLVKLRHPGGLFVDEVVDFLRDDRERELRLGVRLQCDGGSKRRRGS